MEDKPKAVINFHQMELDDRILKAIAKLGWITPTLIQEKAIPFILDEKDVLLRARTGSGKTAAFTIPIIQRILNLKNSADEQKTIALILAPSKELCHQTKKVIDDLTTKCSKIVKCLDLAGKCKPAAQKTILLQKPDIIISTPARLLGHLNDKSIDVKSSLEILVVDEADLMMAFGFEDDVKNILSLHLPQTYQSVLASATLSEQVTELKKLVLHNAIVLKLEEPELPPITQLSHYHIPADEKEKAAILFTLFKLHLIKGKSLTFVNTVDKCYKLKLFLDQFKIRACVLNSELPVKIRCHTVEEFNNGRYDIIIASDEKMLSTRKSKNDNSSGVARGIDFRCVSNVINFDFPRDINSYVHRAGRCARGNNQGNVLSFVSINEQNMMNLVEEHLTASFPNEKSSIIKKHNFKLEEVEPFKYRAQDAWFAVTKSAVREARLKEIKREITNSEKLKTFFEGNTRDFQVFQHDAPITIIKTQEHLSEVPDYIVPAALKNVIGIVTKRKRKTNYSNQKPAFVRENALEFPSAKKKKRN